MAILTKGITLSYKASSSASAYTALTNLKEVPDLGGDVDSLECTSLSDAAHVFCNGLISYRDNLSFNFWYEPTQFAALQALTGVIEWQVGLPDGAAGVVDTTCTFSGECSVKFTGKGTNDLMEYTLNIKPNSAMVWA